MEHKTDLITSFDPVAADAAVAMIRKGMDMLVKMGVRSQTYVYEGTGLDADMHVRFNILHPIGKHVIAAFGIKVDK